MDILYNYKFQLKDSQGDIYKLRQEQLTACLIRYRAAGVQDSFTEVTDFNISEEDDSIWVRLPSLGPTELVLNITLEPLRCVTTALITLNLVPYTTSFVCTATPIPVYSLQGFSPKVIDGYWHEYSDQLQAYINTGVQAAPAILQEGSVVDYAEENNQNAITSNAVWNIYNEQQTINQSVNNNLNEISQHLQRIESNPVKVKINGNVYEQDINGLIDLGVIESGGDGSWMLLRDYEINGTLYKKGTQVSAADDTTIMSTDPEFHYRIRTEVQSTAEDPWFALVSFGSGCYLKLSWTVYTNTCYGIIYCSKSGNTWRFYTTSQEVANTFRIYQRVHTASPVLVCRSDRSGYGSYVKTVTIDSDINLSVYARGWGDMSSGETIDILPFLTSIPKDYVTITGDSYTTSPQDLVITRFVVEDGGPISFLVDEPLEGAVSLDFAVTQNNTTIVFSDTETDAESRVLSAGETARLVYTSPGEVSWIYNSPETQMVMDVMVDGVSCVAGSVAYISSMTAAEVTSIEALFD